MKAGDVISEEFKEGQRVKYEGKETHIESIYNDGTCRIANPDWNWDQEGEFINQGMEYDVPFWIHINLSELTP